MKNNIEEEPKCYFERNTLIIIIWACLALAFDILGYYVLNIPSPWGVFVSIPGLILTIQTLWLILNPYVLFYKTRFEIKQSFIYNKEIYYLDIKLVELKNNDIIMTYNDYTQEKLPIFGLRKSHKQLMFESLKQEIELSNLNRDF